jgi:hypothetical protein
LWHKDHKHTLLILGVHDVSEIDYKYTRKMK